MKRPGLVLLAFLGSPWLFAADDVERLVATMARVGVANSPSFSPDGRLNWNVAGRSEIALLDLKTLWQTRIRLPGDLASLGEFSRDGSKLALTVSGSAAPADIWIYDVPAESVRQITRSPHAGVDLASLVRPELITYDEADGLGLSGWLYRPKDAEAPFATVFSLL